MNKIVFALLLILLGVGLYFPQLNLLLILALVKVLLVVFFYMELREAHAAWIVTVTGLIGIIFGGLFIL